MGRAVEIVPAKDSPGTAEPRRSRSALVRVRWAIGICLSTAEGRRRKRVKRALIERLDAAFATVTAMQMGDVT